MAIAESELPAGTVGRPHIAALMVQKKYVPTFEEAFGKYLKEGGLCYVPGIKFSPEQVIEEIHAAGGKAILAHPHFLKSVSLAERLLRFPFDGIECYYGNFMEIVERPWVALAKRRHLIATGGSDYHGSFKPQIPLGCSWVDEPTFKLFKR
jgi:predicted metal-dependent phosphoesterase TrpH